MSEKTNQAAAKAAGIAWVVAGTLAATAGMAQAPNLPSGVSHPDSTPITMSPDVSDTPSVPVKPSAAIPATAATGSAAVVYGPYVPYTGPGAGASTAMPSTQAFDPDANIVTEATAGRDQRRLLSGPDGSTANDVDAGVVTYVRSRPGEVPAGTVIKVRLREEMSTLTTRPGTKFSAEVSEPVTRDGRVIVPAGSVLEGRVSWVQGGKRIGGPAAIRLDPETVTLPDGTQYGLHAQAIDTDRWDAMKVDDEGSIERKSEGKKTAAEISLATGGGLATGAVLGGVPGAVIGAGVGAGVGTVMWLKSDRQAELHKNLGVVFSLTAPMMVTPASAMMAPASAGPGE